MVLGSFPGLTPCEFQILHNIHGNWKRRDRGIYSIRGGRSLYWLHFGICQLMGPEACFGIFVWVLLGWLSNQSLYQTFSVNPSLLYQAVGMQAIVAKMPFQIESSNLKDFSSFACVPTAWYQRDRFTENIWYKLWLLSQLSNTRTNISKHASGPISWPMPKCKQYKLRPPLIL